MAAFGTSALHCSSPFLEEKGAHIAIIKKSYCIAKLGLPVVQSGKAPQWRAIPENPAPRLYQLRCLLGVKERTVIPAQAERSEKKALSGSVAIPVTDPQWSTEIAGFGPID
jgi:hypothetical protein